MYAEPVQEPTIRMVNLNDNYIITQRCLDYCKAKNNVCG